MNNDDTDWMFISEPDALRLAIAHTLLANGDYPDGAAVRRDIILWAAWLGKHEIIPASWSADGTIRRTSPNLAMGLYQEVPMPPVDYDKLRAGIADMTPEEQQAAAMRYIAQTFGEPTHVMTIKHEEGQGIPVSVVKQQAAVYDAMIRRKLDGSDPLVQEPKSGGKS